MNPPIVVVLGCRCPGGLAKGAARRRALAAARLHRRLGGTVIAAGGERWVGVAECDALAGALTEGGVSPAAIVRERRSRSTNGNAREVAALLFDHKPKRVYLVTCDYHMARAAKSFELHGVLPLSYPVASPPVGARRRFIRALGETTSRALDAVWRHRRFRTTVKTFSVVTLTATLALAVGCEEDPAPKTAPSASASAKPRPPPELAQILNAERLRNSSAITDAMLTHPSGAVRAAATRALARIATAETHRQLLIRLSDEDERVVTWAAYGLGYTCRHNLAVTVDSLTVRAAALAARPPKKLPALPRLGPASTAIADALGRCGSSEAEAILRAWAKSKTSRGDAALYALGRIAQAKKRLEDQTLVDLLKSAGAGRGLALYPFTRLPQTSPSIRKRLVEVAEKILSDKKTGADFAVRALGRTDASAADTLANLVIDNKASASRRAQAASSLVRLGAEAQGELQRAALALIENGPRAQGGNERRARRLADGAERSAQAFAGVAQGASDSDGDPITREATCGTAACDSTTVRGGGRHRGRVQRRPDVGSV